MLLRDRSSSPPFPTAVSQGEIRHPAAYSRHDLRIARILALSDVLGRPISISYLDSCDVRALPLILERLEAECRRRARRATFGGILSRVHDRAGRTEGRS